MQFDTLGLRAELLRAVGEQGYTEATPGSGQGDSGRHGRQRRDGQCPDRHRQDRGVHPALGCINSVVQQGERKLRALILTPTRELAAQVHQNLRDYGRHLSVRSAEIYGGVNINPQITKLKRGVDVLIATPGRLMDHMERGHG